MRDAVGAGPASRMRRWRSSAARLSWSGNDIVRVSDRTEGGGPLDAEGEPLLAAEENLVFTYKSSCDSVKVTRACSLSQIDCADAEGPDERDALGDHWRSHDELAP